MAEPSLPVYFSLFNEIGILHQLSRAILEARLPKGLVLSHFAVLSHLVRMGDGSTPAQLAQAHQVPRNSMTNTLMALERQGLIEMAPNPDDGRSKIVRLTPAGRECRDATIAATTPELEKVAAIFPPDRATELVTELATLRKFLDEDRN